MGILATAYRIRARGIGIAQSLNLWPEPRKFGTEEAEDFWRNFDSFKPGSEARYWGWQDRPHRAVFVSAITASPFRSVLDLGCNSGPNVALIARANREAIVDGVDINEEAVAFGNEQLAAEGLNNAPLRISSLRDLGAPADDSYDVVCASAVLQHIPNEDIENVVREAGRIAKDRLVFIDMHLFAPFGSPYQKLKPERLARFLKDRWARDWWALIGAAIPQATHISVRELPPGANLHQAPDYNALIEVHLQ